MYEIYLTSRHNQMYQLVLHPARIACMSNNTFNQSLEAIYQQQEDNQTLREFSSYAEHVITSTPEWAAEIEKLMQLEEEEEERTRLIEDEQNRI